jgi:hypothetical protein
MELPPVVNHSSEGAASKHTKSLSRNCRRVAQAPNALATPSVVCASLRRIAGWLGQSGINVMTRLMGRILASMAVEIMAAGLVTLFPVLAST